MVAPRMEGWRLRGFRFKILRIFAPWTEVIREVATTHFGYQFHFVPLDYKITRLHYAECEMIVRSVLTTTLPELFTVNILLSPCIAPPYYPPCCFSSVTILSHLRLIMYKYFPHFLACVLLLYKLIHSQPLF
jgi:hypothetical protein